MSRHFEKINQIGISNLAASVATTKATPNVMSVAVSSSAANNAACNSADNASGTTETRHDDLSKNVKIGLDVTNGQNEPKIVDDEKWHLRGLSMQMNDPNEFAIIENARNDGHVSVTSENSQNDFGVQNGQIESQMSKVVENANRALEPDSMHMRSFSK